MNYKSTPSWKRAEKEEKSNKERAGQIKNKTVDISPFFSVITLKTNGSYNPIKIDRI